MLLCNCDHGCCPILSISFVSFFEKKNSNLKQTRAQWVILLSVLFSLPSLMVPSVLFTFLIIMKHRLNIPMALSALTTSFLLSDAQAHFFAFVGVYLLFLATLSPTHPITFSHRWTFGFPRCCLCQIVVLLVCVTVPAWELRFRRLGAQLGYCFPTRSFHSVFACRFEMILKCFLKPPGTKWAFVCASLLLPPSQLSSWSGKKTLSQTSVLSPLKKHGCLFWICLGLSCFLFMAQISKLTYIPWLASSA